MNPSALQHILTHAGESRVLCRLEQMCRKFAGLPLRFFYMNRDKGVDVYTVSEEERLPPCCRLLNEASKEQAQLCRKCRAQILFAASKQGHVVYHACRGVMLTMAAPIGTSVCVAGEHAVACLCGFGPADRAAGWQQVSDMCRELDVDISMLKSAYGSLPSVKDNRLQIAAELLDTATQAVAEAVKHECALREQASEKGYSTRIDRSLETALTLPASGETQHGEKKTGETLIRAVADMISSEPGLPYKLAEIAWAASLTPNYFSALFKKHMDVSFTEFLTQERLALATELLRDATLSISEVSFKAGFDDANYFARRFKQQTGLSPSAWRRGL
jgi:AraC-like DNA-binding protein/ligand-binding sensor protein